MAAESSRIKHDKLSEILSVRIPAVTKANLDAMPACWKSRLNQRLLITSAQVIHESRFDPSLYLTEGCISEDEESK